MQNAIYFVSNIKTLKALLDHFFCNFFQITAGGSGIHRPLKKSKVERVPGSEYRAVKAGGDIKKKGKPDPYVYLPLTRSALNKR